MLESIYDQFYIGKGKDIVCTLKIIEAEKGNYYLYCFDNGWLPIHSNSDYVEESALIHCGQSGYEFFMLKECESVKDCLPDLIQEKMDQKAALERSLAKTQNYNPIVEKEEVLIRSVDTTSLKEKRIPIYSIGLDCFEENILIKILKKKSVKTVIDIRETVPLFGSQSLKHLKNIFDKNNMKYYHFKKIGNPFGENLGYTDVKESLEEYKKHLEKGDSLEVFIDALRRLYKKGGFPAVMIAKSRVLEKCHRSVLAFFLEKNSKLRVRHLDHSLEAQKLFR